MDSSPNLQHIVNGIAVCAADLCKQPAMLSWADFKSWLANKGYDGAFIKTVQDEVKAVGGFANVCKAFFPAALNDKSVEKAEIKALVKEQRAALTSLTSDALFLKEFEEGLTRALKQGVPKLFGYALKVPKGAVPRTTQVFISDTHFGGDLDPREGVTKYGFHEEARRLASIAVRCCEYKRDHRKESDLIVNLGGDLIEGLLHDRQHGLPLASQMADASYLLVQFVKVVASHWRKVTVNCVGGNHDRDATRHPHRAMQGRWDSEATKIYWTVKLAVADVPNVEVNIPMSPFMGYEVFGHRCYLGHGDININVGNPGDNINTKSLERQVNAINNTEREEGRKPFRLFQMGHVHIATIIHLPGTKVITNGCLGPAGPYSKGVGYYSVASGQSMWESTANHPFGDYRFLETDTSIDRDEALEKIIKPFPGVF